MAHHELWRDEIQPWLIARDTPTWSSFFSQLHYEVTPPLWPTLLRFLTLSSTNPMTMQILGWLLGVISFALLVYRSPFSLTSKTLLGLNIFFLYYYTVQSQAYGLGVLGLVLACAWDRDRTIYPRRIGAALAVAALSSIPSLITAMGLAGMHAIDRQNPYRWKILKIFLAGVFLSLGLMQPAADAFNPSSTRWFLEWDLLRFSETLLTFARTLAALPLSTPSFWETSWLQRLPHADVVGVLWGSTLLVVLTFLFRQRQEVWVGYLSATIGLLLFFYLRAVENSLNQGFLFVTFLLTLWIYDQRQSAEHQKPLLKNTMGHTLFGLLLAIQAVGGWTAYSQDLFSPFSNGKSAASYITQQISIDSLIAAGPDYLAVTPAGYEGRKFFFPQGQRWGTFTTWDRRRIDFFSLHEFAARAQKESRERRAKRTILMLNSPISEQDVVALKVIPLPFFRGSLVQDEDYFFYDLPISLERKFNGYPKP